MEAAMDREETLRNLLEASEIPAERSRLASTGILFTLLHRLLPSLATDILSVLKILKNLCTGEAANQNTFLRCGGTGILAHVVGLPLATPLILRAVMQLLGSVALGGEEHRSAVWSSFFPDRFLLLAKVRDPTVLDPLCRLLDTCCSSQGGRRRVKELCDEDRGLEIVIEIFTTALNEGYQEPWLEWLIYKICIDEPYFLRLFQAMSSVKDDGTSVKEDDTSADGGKSTLFTTMQAFFLSLLSKCIYERPGRNISSDFLLSILKVLKQTFDSSYFNSRGTSSLPTGTPVTDVLGYSLIILRDACSESPIDTLLSAGLLDIILNFLRELEPPTFSKRSYFNTQKLCPYRGFRRDLVSVMSNCLRARKEVQDEIRKKIGLLLFFEHCVFDDDNPFLKEWRVLAVRNVLEGNEANQHYAAEFYVLRSISASEIVDLELKVQLDRKSGHIKLVNISEGEFPQL
ncbi:hypothetical protein AXF42_Ash009736 [Apostasia shenzhenica]|uniref:Ataxin-10 domain-containing protein n=1 Tax=Apostasia shenzhenica TaxID=1088818 RepID=A0A2I0AWY0_9ASPA|nr:hypothetical protein AXF42_Ash009736 [Apostasia shenzhenica]